VAVGTNGTILATTNGGSSWFPQVSGTTVTLRGISCFNPATCYAVGDSGAILAISGGSAWSPQTSGTTYNLTAITCPQSNQCVVARDGGLVLTTTNSGANWISRNSQTYSNLKAVSCPSAVTCYAVGDLGQGAISTDGGVNWTRIYSSYGSVEHLAISCPTETTCFVGLASGYIHVSYQSGTNWISQTLFDYSVQGLVCPTTNICVGVGKNGLLVNTTNGGTKWNTRSGGISAFLLSVDCPTATVCYAISAVPAIVLKTSDGGDNWATVFTPTASTSALGATITCPNPSNCFAIFSSYGNPTILFVTNDGGVNWSRQEYPPQSLSNVSCPNATTCFRAIGNTTTHTTNVEVTSNAGVSWSLWSIASFDGISLSCPTTTSCFGTSALDLGGGVYNTIFVSTTDNGTTWNQYNPNLPGVNFTRMVCPAALTCYVMSNTTVFATTDGATWNPQNTGFLASDVAMDISCPSATNCYAMLYTPPVPGKGNKVISTTNGGATWNLETSGSKGVLQGISCPRNTSACFVVGMNGAILSRALVVTLAADDGSGTQNGTLSYALSKASTGQTIYFNLSGSKVISLNKALPPVAAGVRLRADCGPTGPTVTIDGTNAPPDANGLVLSGNNTVTGLKISHFGGKELKVKGNGNKLSCVTLKA
jgi:photosystem II stability/assembly factor-like uncharacterized protein